MATFNDMDDSLGLDLDSLKTSTPLKDSDDLTSFVSPVLEPAAVVESKSEQGDTSAESSRLRTRICYDDSFSDYDYDRRRDSFEKDLNPLPLPRARERNREVDKRRVQRAKRFGINPPTQKRSVTDDELWDLYESMGADPEDVRLRSVLVRGIDHMTEYQVEKIFAEFSPKSVEIIDGVSCNVIWENERDVGKMMLEMTKPLKRIRGGRVIEEGEVAESSDEEEGEMKEEQGDDVTIHKNIAEGDASKPTKCTNDFVEIDVDQVDIPPGKWRVIMKHVEKKRLIILRFSTEEDMSKGKKSLTRSELIADREQKEDVNRDGFSYKWMHNKNRVRPGLNIFNKEGDELEWDYEHDTRFFVDLDKSEKSILSQDAGSPLKRPSRPVPPEEVSEEKEGEPSVLGKRKIKCKGRGAKKLRSLDEILNASSSMAADVEEKGLVERRRLAALAKQDEEIDDGAESDMSSDRDPSPTPQPWDTEQSSFRSDVIRTRDD